MTTRPARPARRNIGKAIPWAPGAALVEATPTARDVPAAVALWARYAPAQLRGLLDAKPI